jgi:predicted  nucleic acid-binding Zn-ribbon protein
MTIEVMTLITGISVTLGIVSTLINLRRNSRVDTKATIIEAATLNNKIDNVLIGISELKVKLNAMEADQKDSRERIIILEEKVKTLFNSVSQLQEHVNIDSK